MNFDGPEILTRLKLTCGKIFVDQKDVRSVEELETLLKRARPLLVKNMEQTIFPLFCIMLKKVSENKNRENEKILYLKALKAFFDKIKIEKLMLFFNIYGFLLFEIYDHENHSIFHISEEYKLAIVECMTSLCQSLSFSTLEELYVRENSHKLCEMMFVLLQLASKEQSRDLRIAAITAVMAMARVLEDDDFNDIVLRDKIAQVFIFFLPGIANQLKTVALIDEKHGHKIPTVALKAWGRIVTLLMQDYSPHDQKIDVKKVKMKSPNRQRFKSEIEMKEYLKATERSPQWYAECEHNLRQIIVEFTPLTHHSHDRVRNELLGMATLLIENCTNTMPTAVINLIDIVIILSEDSDESISRRSNKTLVDLSSKLSEKEFRSLFDSLEESFYSILARMPRTFNGVDEKAQIVTLNALIGYLNLFGRHGLSQILLSSVHLNNLILTLLHISEFEKSNVSTLEEYTSHDLDLDNSLKPTWKKFVHFKEEVILGKIEKVCYLLAKNGATQTVSAYLLETISSSCDQRKEAIFLLNNLLTGTPLSDMFFFKTVVSTYTSVENWDLPLCVMIDEWGNEHTLGDIQNNIIQVCLLVEGIGKVAKTIRNMFEQFMLKTLHLLLERAGSSNFMIRTAGLAALLDISIACGFSSITELINKNMDYFSFHIARKINRAKSDKGGLDVLSVVIKYSTKEVLNSTCDVIRELLIRTYDTHRPNLNSYLQVFKMFVLGLHKWLDLQILAYSFKTRKQKEEACEEFQVSNIEPIENFSDDIMGKTAEEMYAEDLENKVDENLESEEYKKPEPPIEIKLTFEILKRSLNFLPSKDINRKLLVLEILRNGVVVLQDWENELLPIAHQIWSPLVDRFKETNEPVIVNYSFQLLLVLAALSKDFIRSRTSKDVLPEILKLLDNLAIESYLKDKGHAYRYSQNFKLQILILENLVRILTDLDMLPADFHKSVDTVFSYISDKQPVPLQTAGLHFFEIIIKYDPESYKEKVQSKISDISQEFEKNSRIISGYIGVS